MSTCRILTLLTDFGLSDAYVGIMKGVIAAIAPQIHIIDLTHQIPPQNIAAARFNLMNAYPYFPEGTVHVAVVDPGVGGSRRAIALQLPTGFLVGPDNGLLDGVLSRYGHDPSVQAVDLNNPAYWRNACPSSTFHGRDIFAPVGAHLARGVSLQELGTAISVDSLVEFDIPDAQKTTTQITGYVQHIDHFGNVITNISGDEVRSLHWSVEVKHTQVPSRHTYGESAIGEMLALVGSHGWIEIAVNGGSAQARLHMGVRDVVTVYRVEKDTQSGNSL